MAKKGYCGLDVDFEYVPPELREDYAAFVCRMREALNTEGKPVVAALAPKTSAQQRGLLYEAHDYALLSKAANAVFLMTYEWGYTYGPPMAVAPIQAVRQVLDYAVTEIPPEKILMGFPKLRIQTGRCRFNGPAKSRGKPSLSKPPGPWNWPSPSGIRKSSIPA
mgnify:CR=1 FL=1